MKPFLHPIILVLTLLALPAVLAPAATAAAPELGRYIVVLHDDVDSPGAVGREIARQAGGRIGFVYEHAIRGFSIRIPVQALAGLVRNPSVKYVAADDVRHVFAQTLPTGIRRIFANANSNIGIDGADDYRVDVDVAVIDTGIDIQHPDLDVRGGVTCTEGIVSVKCVAGGDDDHYHGTHVAGTIGALDNGEGVVGVAPGARLWAVKVLNSKGSGYSSWVIAGIDWVAANAATIEVANMSIGGSGYSQAEYDAIQGAVNKGVAFAVAAGNNDDDANYYSPAAFDNVLTVSALADFNGLPGGGAAATCRSDQDDTLADFSNWGPQIDIAAPGVCILSTYPVEKGSYATLSGTSMASPHAAGALALLASRNNPGNANDVANLYHQVKSAGNFNWSDDSGDGLQERLLDVSNASLFNPVLAPGSAGSTNTAPAVTIGSPANGASFASGTPISFAGTAADAQDGNLTGSLIWTSSIAGSIGSGGSFSAVLAGGTHTITAAAADSGGLTGSATVTVTVEPASGASIALNVRAYTLKSGRYADLSWSGAASAQVEVYRDGSRITATPNDGAYTNKVAKTTASADYQVCEAGTKTCSGSVPANW